MQDRKALQAGTSHFLGQNFAKASGIQFTDENNKLEHAWTTSWGVSTRLVGGMIMTHADDDGMICPPRLAPAHVVILPIAQKPEDRAARDRLLPRAAEGAASAAVRRRAGARASSTTATSAAATRSGSGSRRACRSASRSARATSTRTRVHGPPRQGRRRRRPACRAASSSRRSRAILAGDPGRAVRSRARVPHASTRARSTRRTTSTRSSPIRRRSRTNDPTPIHAGFALAHFNGDPALEAKIKDDLKVTVRCIPLDAAASPARARSRASRASSASSGPSHTDRRMTLPHECPGRTRLSARPGTRTRATSCGGAWVERRGPRPDARRARDHAGRARVEAAPGRRDPRVSRRAAARCRRSCSARSRSTAARRTACGSTPASSSTALKEAKHFRAEPHAAPHKPHESLLHKLGKLLAID